MDPEIRDVAEVARIRAAYGERDSRPSRHPAIAHAYRLVNADRITRMRAAIEQLGSDRPRILDVGCGGGYDLSYWLSAGWPPSALAGVDLVKERIAIARDRCPGVDLRITSGSELPFASDSFDVATAVTVFSSILDLSVRRRLFDEMRRVVRPGGSIFVYDFVIKNPRNPDVVAISYGRLIAMGGRPTESVSITPLIQAVALASRFGRRLTRIAMRFAPRTHRLSRWLVSEEQAMPSLLEPAHEAGSVSPSAPGVLAPDRPALRGPSTSGPASSDEARARRICSSGIGAVRP
jgi:ubiquinone/menaquinone biosynthesis C-methylase UbiE